MLEYLIITALIGAVVILVNRQLTKNSQKNQTIKILKDALRVSLAMRNADPAKAERIARQVADSVTPEPVARLVGGGTAITTPLGEAFFALAIAAEKGRGGPDEESLYFGLGELASTYSPVALRRSMTAMDEEQLRFAGRVYLAWSNDRREPYFTQSSPISS